MAIVKQIDSDHEGDGVVAFIDATSYSRKHRSFEIYSVEIHRKPLDGFGVACPHEHREIDAAVRCAKRLMRAIRLGKAAGDGE